jgi:hypothetical protein
MVNQLQTFLLGCHTVTNRIGLSGGMSKRPRPDSSCRPANRPEAILRYVFLMEASRWLAEQAVATFIPKEETREPALPDEGGGARTSAETTGAA